MRRCPPRDIDKREHDDERDDDDDVARDAMMCVHTGIVALRARMRTGRCG